MSNTEHIHLLSEGEITELYARPDFNNDEQKLYFTLNVHELDALNHYSNIKTRVYFILQLGYFKAKQQFFKFDLAEVETDVEYVLSHFFNDAKTALSGRISRDYFSQQKNDILSLLGFQDWSSIHVPQIESHICELLRYHPNTYSALRQLLNYFENQQIIIPTYRTLQDIFTSAFSTEERRLSNIVLSIPENEQRQLSVLIERKDGFSQLNIIRADQKDFQYTAIKSEVEKAQSIASLYAFAKDFIPTLKLSKNAIRYYADVAEQYAAFRLRQLNKPRQWLYAICFVYHRYQQIMDNLGTSFMYHTKDILVAGKTHAGIAMMEHSSRMLLEFPKLAQFLKWFPKRDKNLTHDALDQTAYSILPEEQFPVLAEFMEGNSFDKKAAQWEFYAKSSRTFSLYLRPIFMTVPFEFYKENSQLTQFMKILKFHYANGGSPSTFRLPDDVALVIPKNMLSYLKLKPTDEHIDPYLFEFFVYKKMHHQFGRGRLYCNDSILHCDLEQDLVDDTLVDDVESIAAKFGYPKIPIYCDQRLEPVQSLFNSNTKKAKTTICKLVFIFLSQFFHKRRHFSNQANDLSTTHRFGITANLCNSLRLATSTVALIIFFISFEKFSPV
ncbi:hypothetical protein BH10PSE19_BH10PSE19_10470 [soil metagenome]